MRSTGCYIDITANTHEVMQGHNLPEANYIHRPAHLPSRNKPFPLLITEMSEPQSFQPHTEPTHSLWVSVIGGTDKDTGKRT